VQNSGHFPLPSTPDAALDQRRGLARVITVQLVRDGSRTPVFGPAAASFGCQPAFRGRLWPPDSPTPLFCSSAAVLAAFHQRPDGPADRFGEGGPGVPYQGHVGVVMGCLFWTRRTLGRKRGFPLA
jgi:hypothetical protein